MNHWTIELWENRNKVCYVEKDLLKDLSEKDPILLRRLLKKKETLTKYTISQAISANDLENIGYDLWELKFCLPKAEIRYLGCLVHGETGSIFYALCAFRKKDQKIRNKHLSLARDRKKEFEKNK